MRKHRCIYRLYRKWVATRRQYNSMLLKQTGVQGSDGERSLVNVHDRQAAVVTLPIQQRAAEAIAEGVCGQLEHFP